MGNGTNSKPCAFVTSEWVESDREGAASRQIEPIVHQLSHFHMDPLEPETTI